MTLAFRYENRRFFTPAEDATMRKLYGKQSIASLAILLNRSSTGVFNRAKRLGLTFNRAAELGPAFVSLLRQKNKAGWSDTEIANHWGAHPQTVSKHRKLLGLPSNRHNRRHALKTYAASRKQWGCGSLVEFRWMMRDVKLARSGWPVGCTALEVRVLEQLATGPKTSRMIRQGIGYRTDAARTSIICPASHGKCVTKILAGRGLVVNRGKRMGQIPGQRLNECVYALVDGVARRERVREVSYAG